MVQKEDSIRKGILALKQKILISAGEEFLSWPDEKQNKFFERTILAIAKDEKLASCFESAEGKLSMIAAVEKSVSTGLFIGGVHAYLVPQPKKSRRKDQKGADVWITEVRFSIRDRGYYALLCGGKRPIFKDLRWGQVYEEEVKAGNVQVDTGTGEVIHKQFIDAKKGLLIGCWVQALKFTGQKEAQFYHIEKINQWRDSSSAYQYAIKNKYKDTPWLSWPDEMALESCIRHFCDKYETAREMIASAIYDEESQEKPQAPEKTSVEKIEAALQPENPVDQNTIIQVPEVEKKPENNNDELDIF